MKVNFESFIAKNNGNKPAGKGIWTMNIIGLDKEGNAVSEHFTSEKMLCKDARKHAIRMIRETGGIFGMKKIVEIEMVHTGNEHPPVEDKCVTVGRKVKERAAAPVPVIEGTPDPEFRFGIAAENIKRDAESFDLTSALTPLEAEAMSTIAPFAAMIGEVPVPATDLPAMEFKIKEDKPAKKAPVKKAEPRPKNAPAKKAEPAPAKKAGPKPKKDKSSAFNETAHIAAATA